MSLNYLQNYNEQKAVRELCEQIGYGNVMDIASREWQAHLASTQRERADSL